MLNMTKALVLVELKNGNVKKASLETIHALASQGAEVDAIAFGPEASAHAAAAAKAVGGQGAKKFLKCDNADLKFYQADIYASTLFETFKSGAYSILAGAASALVKDLFPTLAARLGAGIAPDCVSIKLEGGSLSAKRPMLAGKYFATLKFKTFPAVVSVRPNVMALGADSGALAQVLDVNASGTLRAKTVEIVGASGSSRPDLSEADRIISAGRAIKAAENFKIIEACADVIGAAVGASRAAVDAGMAPHSMQVGQTGKTVNPSLYIACGISGAIQHLAGMKTSKVIVAINTDPEAPIFQKADYGAVGDLFEVVPALTEEFKKLLSAG
jgi:electron transfer flavoprotein alpha subunit